MFKRHSVVRTLHYCFRLLLHDTIFALLYTILRCSTLLYNTMHTLPYSAENDGARTVTLFYHSVWSICLISSTSILLFTTLHNFTLPCVALLYLLCTVLHHFALLCSTLHFTPLCIHLSCPPTQRIRGRTSEPGVGGAMMNGSPLAKSSG